MKKTFILALSALSLVSLAWAAETMWIQRTDNIKLGLPLEIADSVSLSQDGTKVIFTATNGVVQTMANSEVDKVTMGASSSVVEVNYNGTNAEIVNPFAFEGVTVTKNGADVIVTSTSANELSYKLTGTTSSGSFKIYSDTKFILDLNSVSITNNDGAAINVQTGKKCTVQLNGTSNLTDASSYATVSGEDQKGCFFSEGQIVFTGSGTLNVTGNYKHGIVSDDYIDIQSGTVNVLKSANDGIRVNDYFLMSGGVLSTASTTGDGIDGDAGYIQIDGGTININLATADTKAIKCDSVITVNGGNVTLTVPAAQGKGFKTKQTMTVNGGTITANMTGAVAIVSNDPSYCTAFKTDGDFVMNDGTIYVTHSGAGGKGISADGNVSIKGGKITITVTGTNGTYTNTSGVLDSYSSTCISADGSITVDGGTTEMNVKATQAKGMSADKYITINGGTIKSTLTGGVALISNDPSYCTAIKSDIDLIINGGDITINHSGVAGKGLSVDGSSSINGGTVNITTTGNGANYTNASGESDTYSATCIKVDQYFGVTGKPYLNLLSSGSGGKCINVGYSMYVGLAEDMGNADRCPTIIAETKGTQINQSSGSLGMPGGSGGNGGSPKVIKVGSSWGDLTVYNGDFTIKSASEGGEGLESKNSMNIKGGNFYFNTYDDCINTTNSLTISGGNLRCVATGNDAVDSNGSMTISGGLILANGTREPEEGVDVDNASQLKMTGGTIINQKGNMLNLTTTQCQVPTIKYSSSISAGTLITVTTSTGAHIMSFKAPQAMSQGCYITLPEFVNGSSYKLYTGGSVSGGTVFNEVTRGGTFTDGTQVKSFTISSNLTSL